MICTSLRSSSFNTYSACQRKFFCSYVLGLPEDSNHKAKLGNAVHKAIEILAKYKFSIQQGKKEFEEDGNIIKTSEINNKFCVEYGFKAYKEDYWSDADFKFCKDSFDKAMTYNGGEFNPMYREVIAVEHFFDFEIPDDWASYYFRVGDEVLQGQLRIRGTADAIYKNTNGTLSYVDWKSGARNTDFATGKVKDYDYCLNDPQLLLYFFSLNKTLPQFDEAVMTLFFINAGGPVSVPMSKDDLPRAKNMLKSRFLEIKNNQRPAHIRDNSKHNWKCKFVCSFNKTAENGKTVCENIGEAIDKHGINKVTEKLIDIGKLNRYEGGGAERKL